MKIYKYEMEILIDEANLPKKYPNFRINYENEQEFVHSIVAKKEENEYKKFGFSVRIKKV